jgi:hypothetical protein
VWRMSVWAGSPVTQLPKTALMTFCQVGPYPDLTHSPLGATCQIELTLWEQGGRLPGHWLQDKKWPGRIHISQLPAMGEEERRGQSCPFCRSVQNNPSQVPKSVEVTQMAPVSRL